MSRVPDERERTEHLFKALDEMGEDLVSSEHSKLRFGNPGEFRFILVSNWLDARNFSRVESRASRAERRSSIAMYTAIAGAIIAIIGTVISIIVNMDKIFPLLRSWGWLK